MPRGVHALSGANESAALAYLERSPVENVFLTWLIESGGASARSSIFVALDADGAAEGVIAFGRQVVLAAQSDRVIRALANAAPIGRRERMIVGVRHAVNAYWECVRELHPQPRAVRESQPVFRVDAASLQRDGFPEVRVRRANAGDLKVVADNSALMVRQELEYDPRSAGIDFDGGVRTMIERGAWWVGESGGGLCFFCNSGARSAHTLQLQGVWTPQHLRGGGLAAGAFSAICEALLKEVPSLSLYANAFNAPAIALYERCGFRQVSEFKTLLF